MSLPKKLIWSKKLEKNEPPITLDEKSNNSLASVHNENHAKK